MKGLLKDFLYLHGLFVFILYFIGNFFTVIILEYQLKNSNLKHTLAAFGCVALSGMTAYFVPALLLGPSHSSFLLQLISVAVACITQAIFWLFWFKKGRLKEFLPALGIAFGLSVVISMLLYSAFTGYIAALIKGGISKMVSPV
ncbi:hypothetical protein ACFLX2_00400 [Candidatus Dependentiae bacterium]